MVQKILRPTFLLVQRIEVELEIRKNKYQKTNATYNLDSL